jgi:hypothetical protein
MDEVKLKKTIHSNATLDFKNAFIAKTPDEPIALDLTFRQLSGLGVLRGVW